MPVYFTYSFQIWHDIGLPRYDTKNGGVLEEMWSMNIYIDLEEVTTPRHYTQNPTL